MKTIILLLLVACFISSCDRGTLAEKRAHYAAKKTGDIRIGAVWAWSHSPVQFRNGINLAAEQINAAGGIMGRKITLIERDDKSSINQGLVVAQHFAADTKVNFVISHESSFIAVPALATYSLSGLLLLESSSTSTQLTEQGYSHIFRIAPNNRQMANYLAAYAKSQNYKRMIIMYVRNEYGRNLANFFALAAEDHDIRIVERISYLSQGRGYLDVVKDWDEFYNFDAVLLIGSMPDAAYIIKAAREGGIHQAILSDNALYDKSLLEIAREAANGVVVLSNFNSESTNPKTKEFIKAYQKQFGIAPDERAAYAYTSLMLLAYAIEKTQSTDVPTVAKFLHDMKPWHGVMGKISFDQKGDLQEADHLIKLKVENKKFQVIQ